MSAIAPVVVAVELDRPPKVAFEVFTHGFGRWWPHLVHSLGEEKVEAVVMEARPGGRLFERWGDGTVHVWGTIRVFDPPGRVAFSWDPAARGADTEVEVTFVEMPSGRTRVELVHRGWEVLGAEASEVRTSYESGWPRVLDAFSGRLEDEAI